MALLPHILRARVHCPDVAALAEDARDRAPLHRAGLALGERLPRIVHRQDAGPVSQWRAVLDAPRSADSDGTLADPRQYRPSAQESRGASHPLPKSSSLRAEGSHGRWYNYFRLVTRLGRDEEI